MEAARDVPAFSRLVGNARQSVGAPAEVQRAERRTRQCMLLMTCSLPEILFPHFNPGSAA